MEYMIVLCLDQDKTGGLVEVSLEFIPYILFTHNNFLKVELKPKF